MADAQLGSCTGREPLLYCAPRACVRRVAVRAGELQAVSRLMHVMPSVSTTEILARRALQRPCGQDCVDWAIGMLERGYSSRNLLMLAGMSEPLNHFELAEMRDRALAETNPPEVALEDPLGAFAAELLGAALRGERPLLDAVGQIKDLSIELGYPRELNDFYLLYFAWEDLRQSDQQWYWDGATRENIEALIREHAEKFVAAHGG